MQTSNIQKEEQEKMTYQELDSFHSIQSPDDDPTDSDLFFDFDIESPDQRCLIKSHITSKELVSNGVKIKIICENLIDGNWYLSKSNFINEEKWIATLYKDA